MSSGHPISHDRGPFWSGIAVVAGLSTGSVWELFEPSLDLGRVMLITGTLFVVIWLIAALVTRSMPGRRPLMVLVFGSNVAWAVVWTSAGLVVRSISDIAIALELPTFGLLFGIVSGATFGLISFVRFGALPQSLGAGGLLGLLSALVFFLITLLGQLANGGLMRGDSNSMLTVLAFCYLVAGATTGAALAVVARISASRDGPQATEA